MMYDVAIVGAGPAGLFAAYELIKNNKNLKIAVSAAISRCGFFDGQKQKGCNFRTYYT